MSWWCFHRPFVWTFSLYKFSIKFLMCKRKRGRNFWKKILFICCLSVDQSRIGLINNQKFILFFVKDLLLMSPERIDLASSRSQSLLWVVPDQLRVHQSLFLRRSGSSAPGCTRLRYRSCCIRSLTWSWSCTGHAVKPLQKDLRGVLSMKRMGSYDEDGDLLISVQFSTLVHYFSSLIYISALFFDDVHEQTGI